MTASVAAGETVTPVLVPAAAETPSARASLAPDSTAALREMMRRTVTHGTAHELSNVPGDPVYGKTGTAEYGTDVPPRTHSWFSGYQGDMAFAVLVEDGGFGAEAAVPLAHDFLMELES